jgi:hypothetical protein
MENVGIFPDHLEYLRPFGLVCGLLAHFLSFWYVLTKTNLATPMYTTDRFHFAIFCFQLALDSDTSLESTCESY